MKKIIFAICFGFVSVTSVFAKDVVIGIYDDFDVSMDYLNVVGFSEKQIEDIVAMLVGDYKDDKYNEENQTYRLSLSDFADISEKAGISEDDSVSYVLGVLNNAVKAGTATMEQESTEVEGQPKNDVEQ